MKWDASLKLINQYILKELLDENGLVFVCQNCIDTITYYVIIFVNLYFSRAVDEQPQVKIDFEREKLKKEIYSNSDISKWSAQLFPEKGKFKKSWFSILLVLEISSVEQVFIIVQTKNKIERGEI